MDDARRRRIRTERTILAILLVVVLAAAFALKRHNDRLDRETGGLYVPKKVEITPEVQRLQEYVRIDTTNPPGNETAAARWLGAILAKERIAFEVIESAPGRGNLYARIKGKRAGEGLLLLNHMDVMPADAKAWSQPPFEAKAVFNQLYGRGTLDMKGIAICELEAFLEVARAKRQPERDVVFLATADEERGSTMGLRWLLEHRPDVVAGVRYAINEGGITETLREELTYFGIEIGSKQMVSVPILAPTREQLRAARIALEPSMRGDEPARLLPEVQRYFHDIAPQRVEQRELLTDMHATVARGKFWLLPKNIRELLQNNVFVQGPVPSGDGWSMTATLLDLPDERPDDRLAWLAAAVKPYGARLGEPTRKDGPVPLSSAATPFFGLLRAEIRATYGNVPVGTMILNASINDSRLLRTRGIDCYGVWPFPVDFFQTRGIHGVDERLRIDWFRDGVELTKRVVAAYAFGR